MLTGARRAAMLLLTTLLLTMTAQTAWADTGYNYKGADGTMRNTYTDDHIPDDWVTVLTDGTSYLIEGWNYVSGNVNLTDGISVSAPDAETDHYFHLILADGASLTINLESSSCISIGERCSLTIYGQTNGTGTLNVTSQNYSHAIVGGTGSSITLYGGIINANAGGSNCGIYVNNIYLAGATVYASSYGGNVSASCKYKDSDNNEYEGSIYDTGAIAGKTLTPFGTVASTSVMLDPQGGSGGTESVTVTNGAAMPTITPPTRTGYTFGGYYDGMDGAGTKYYNADGSSANNWNHTGESFVLSAKWTANTYTVNLDPQEGSGGTGSVTVTYDAAMPSATMPTRTGYIFCGYFTGTNGGGIKYYNADGSSAHTWDITTDNTTLYAYWKKLLTNGDIHVDIPAQTYSGTVLDPVVTVKDGETVISNDNNEHYTIALPDGRMNAGNYVVTITAKDESALYTGSVTATFIINKAPLNVTAKDKNIEYGDEPANNGVEYGEFVDGEDKNNLVGTLQFNYSYTKGDPVGDYQITPEGLTSDNYAITFVSGKLTVAKKSLTITANDHRILYGNAAANNGVSYAGFVNGETENVLSGELKYTYTNDSGPYGAGNDAPGEYVITPYDLTATNYAITFVPGKLTVEAVTVKVKVVDIINGEELTGAHVQVLNDDENFVVEWNSGTEIHEVGGLKAGKTYTVHETAAPDGFILPTDNTFTIATDGTVTYSGTTTDESGNTVLLVQNSMTHVEISVVDKLNGEKLAEGHVQVIDSEGLVDEWDSKSDENHIIEGLETGVEYTIHETVAPDGYTVATDITFTIGTNGTITFSGNTTTDEDGLTVLLVENSMTKVKISVVDVADGEELEGATVQVIEKKDDNEEEVAEWTSTTEIHEIRGLKTGVEYTLRETVAPEGYIIPAATKFTIDESGKVTTTGTITEDGVLLVENSKTQVNICVVDIADGAEIEGAIVQVIEKKDENEEEVVEEWTSTTEPHEIEGLKTGVEYTLRETVAPEGYTVATDITFTIDESGKVTTTGTITEDGVLLVENSKTQVKISVVDIADGAEIAGATVQVIDSEGNVVEEWTSTTEPHVIEGLATGEEYTAHETGAPSGYAIPTDFTFTIAEDGSITSSGSNYR